jgi:hypothetical protein
LAVAAAVLALTGCHLSESPWCLELDSPCPGTSQGNFVTYHVVGFPADRVGSTQTQIGGFPLTFHVGETVTLYYVRVHGMLPVGSIPTDTLRDVTWSVSPDSAVRITTADDGSGVLTAIHEGSASWVLVNGEPQDKLACTQSGISGSCAPIATIVVTAP